MVVGGGGGVRESCLWVDFTSDLVELTLSSGEFGWVDTLVNFDNAVVLR